MNKKSDYELDITDAICPMTFVRTKLLIEKMQSGQVADVRLKGAEPLENVPRSAQDLGHEVLSLSPEPGEGPEGVHHLLIKKA